MVIVTYLQTLQNVTEHLNNDIWELQLLLRLTVPIILMTSELL